MRSFFCSLFLIFLLCYSIISAPTVSLGPTKLRLPRLICRSYLYSVGFLDAPVLYDNCLYGILETGSFAKRSIYGQTEWEFGKNVKQFFIQFNTIVLLDKSGRLMSIDAGTGYKLWESDQQDIQTIWLAFPGILGLSKTGQAVYLDFFHGFLIWKSQETFSSLSYDEGKIRGTFFNRLYTLNVETGASVPDPDGLIDPQIPTDSRQVLAADKLRLEKESIVLNIEGSTLELIDKQDGTSLGKWEIPSSYVSIAIQTLNFTREDRRIWLVHPKGVLEVELP